MTSIINAAHAKHSRVTLTLSVFAWTSGQVAVQKALLGSSAARLNLARQAVAAVRDRGADGINLDFEPLVSGYEDEFVALIRTIRAELKKVAPGYHLSFDTLGYPGNYPLEGALASGGADAVLIMGYDYRTAGSNYAGSIDPLAGPAYDLADTVRTYIARVPASRVILGVPYYGRAWSTVSSAVNSRTQTGAKYGYSNAVNYSIAVDYAAKHGRRYDGREVSAWVAYRRQNCTVDLRLRDLVAPGLLRRRDDAQGALRPREPGRAARGGDLGPGLRRDAPRALPGARRQVPPRHDAPDGGDRGAARRARATRASGSPGRPSTTGTASAATTSRCRSTAARGRPGTRRPRLARPGTSGGTATATRSGCGRATARATSPRGTSRA